MKYESNCHSNNYWGLGNCSKIIAKQIKRNRDSNEDQNLAGHSVAGYSQDHKESLGALRELTTTGTSRKVQQKVFGVK